MVLRSTYSGRAAAQSTQRPPDHGLHTRVSSSASSWAARLPSTTRTAIDLAAPLATSSASRPTIGTPVKKARSSADTPLLVMTRVARPLALVLGLLAVVVPGVEALPPGSPEAAEALALCERADRHRGAGRVELLTRGLELAEARVRLDPRDPLAHFALFCNLGRRVQATGLGITMAFDVLRARRALDRALALAPDDPDVLTAKGVLTIELPRLLGGDPAGGEQWFRRALAQNPQHELAHWYLTDLLARRGAGPEAAALQASR